MKKVLLAISIAAAALSSSVFAEPIASGTPIDNADCPLLGSAVTINLSSKVVGAFECDEAATTVVVATCSSAGSRAAKTLPCVNYAAAGEPADWNDASCATGGKVVNGAPSNTFDGIGYTGYKASSAGGGVGGVNLDGTCNDNSIGAEL